MEEASDDVLIAGISLRRVERDKLVQAEATPRPPSSTSESAVAESHSHCTDFSFQKATVMNAVNDVFVDVDGKYAEWSIVDQGRSTHGDEKQGG